MYYQRVENGGLVRAIGIVCCSKSYEACNNPASGDGLIS